MTRQKNIQMTLTGFLLSLLLILFLIPIQSGIKANDLSIQDSAKQSPKMSQMKRASKGAMKADMQKMHKNMMGMKMTGNPDYDFASLMIRHHKGAINMSQKELSKGKDQDVKSIAKNIINDQNKEITELQAFVKKNKPSKTSTSGSSDVTGSSDKSMMDKMTNMQKDMQDMKMTGNQDKDYVSMMIMHHQHGIDLAKDYMDKGKDDNLKKMAQKMVDENQQQVDKLKDWQSKNK